MRTITLFLFAFATSAACAQPPSFDNHLTFDAGSDIALDSIYGAAGWQVGDPGKPVFDSAYSAPNALVTDTLLPYPVGTSYAEFQIPVNFYGELVEMEFQQRMDVDSGEAYGWLEYFDDFFTFDWKIVKQYDQLPGGDIVYTAPGMGLGGPGGMETDSGLVFSYASPTWTQTAIYFMCYGVFQPSQEYRAGGGGDSMRFRFVFQGLQNSGLRDGWMIDNVHASSWGCPGAMTENSLSTVQVHPVPTGDVLFLDGGVALPRSTSLELYRADGSIVLKSDLGSMTLPAIDLSHLSNGLYLLRLAEGASSITRTVVVQR